MTTASMGTTHDYQQDIASTERDDHATSQVRPFLVAMAIVVLSGVVFLAMTGMPH